MSKSIDHFLLFDDFDEQQEQITLPSSANNNIEIHVSKHNSIYITSREIADVMGQEHKNVLAAIRKIKDKDTMGVTTKMFYPSSYKDSKNRTQPEYFINQAGFNVLATRNIFSDTSKMLELSVALHKKNEEIREKLNQAVKKIQEMSNNKPREQLISEALIMANDVINEQKSLIQNQQQTIEDKEQEIKNMTPDAEFGKSLKTSTNNILVRQLANRIVTALKNEGLDASHIGEKNLFAWLRDNRYLIRSKSRDYNNPTKMSLCMEIMQCRLNTIEHKTVEGTWTSGTPEITPKGVEYFINKFKKIYREGGTILDGIKDKK